MDGYACLRMKTTFHIQCAYSGQVTSSCDFLQPCFMLKRDVSRLPVYTAIQVPHVKLLPGQNLINLIKDTMDTARLLQWNTKEC